MRSFYYGKLEDKVMQTVLELYKGHTNEKVRGIPTLDYFPEVFDAVYKGTVINNLINFILGIQNNTKMNQGKKAKLEKAFVDYDCDFQDGVVEETISDDRVDEKDGFAEKDAEIMFEEAVSYIKEQYKNIVIKHGINLPKAIENSLNGISQSVGSLKMVCDAEPEVADAVYTILKSGHKFQASLCSAR